MYIAEIQYEIDEIKKECNEHMNIIAFANTEVERLVKQYPMKESQAMFLVMTAINKYIEEVKNDSNNKSNN
ncbi:MAG: hypothetical protein M0R03_11075 [Novosphingobium sp.]|nr:hypothetical protein [Novosphingobium sp.]